ncbi:hypothetical protein HKD37_19G053739 [Glycine soja]
MTHLARQIRSVSGICLVRHTTRLAGRETLEEDKSEMCSPHAQPARPARTLSLFALSAPSLAKPKSTYSRLASQSR